MLFSEQEISIFSTWVVTKDDNSLEVIAGQLVAIQMLLEAVIIDGIRSGALSSELMLKVLEQGIEKFPQNKNLTKNELFGALGVLTSAIQAVSVATTGKID